MNEVKCCTVRLNAWLDEIHITFRDRDFKPGLLLTAASSRFASKYSAEILPRFCRDFAEIHIKTCIAWGV